MLKSVKIKIKITVSADTHTAMQWSMQRPWTFEYSIMMIMAILVFIGVNCKLHPVTNIVIGFTYYKCIFNSSENVVDRNDFQAIYIRYLQLKWSHTILAYQWNAKPYCES